MINDRESGKVKEPIKGRIMINHLLREPSGYYVDMNNERLNFTEFDYPYIVKKPYRHKKKSCKGNIKRTKHKFHRGSNTLLEVTVPSGIIDNYKHVETFKTVEQAKAYIRQNITFLKDSSLTNISSAVNGTGRFKGEKIGRAYGLIFRNVSIQGTRRQQ